MGLFDGLTGGSGTQGVAAQVMELLGKQQGGLAGLAATFQQKGLGDIVSSWIGTGQNLPVSADQIQQVLGNDQIRSFAEKAGISTDAAGSQLADLLPGIVDKLTPGGQIPESGDLMSGGAALLRNLFSGGKEGS